MHHASSRCESGRDAARTPSRNRLRWPVLELKSAPVPWGVDKVVAMLACGKGWASEHLALGSTSLSAAPRSRQHLALGTETSEGAATLSMGAVFGKLEAIASKPPPID
ncbi:hypothetical protein G6O67_000562 [Ophiocordyceps sinensis]|uniref:Uncharacterized protein n=1 Tax=Ophiocordyceps sinensis TaxID=72228 RepID=A0A8H4V9S3_9HYPO|nr:hypothetical protein G6O67_000562 [Ophiocordyceps sinensis]